MKLSGYLRDATVKTAAAPDNVQKRTLTLKIEGVAEGPEADGLGAGLVGQEVFVDLTPVQPGLPLGPDPLGEGVEVTTTRASSKGGKGKGKGKGTK